MCSLASDGDAYEQKYYGAFIRNEFPSYDRFWAKHVVPLTNRPVDIHFKTDSALAAAGKDAEDLCISQLHYTVLRHLARAYDIRRFAQVGIDELTEGVVRISGAQDVAFELLERYTNRGAFDPWLARGSGGSTGAKKGSKEAREAWQKKNGYPLQPIRDYRNHLVHGRISPAVIVGSTQYVPAIGKEGAYFDWRAITQHPTPASLVGTDLAQPPVVLDDAWRSTIGYLEAAWQAHL